MVGHQEWGEPAQRTEGASGRPEGAAATGMCVHVLLTGALGWCPGYQGQDEVNSGVGETYTPVILICPSSSRRMLEERGGKQML